MLMMARLGKIRVRKMAGRALSEGSPFPIMEEAGVRHVPNEEVPPKDRERSWSLNTILGFIFGPRNDGETCDFLYQLKCKRVTPASQRDPAFCK